MSLKTISLCLLMLSCGKSSFSSFNLGSQNIDSEQEHVTISEAISQDETETDSSLESNELDKAFDQEDLKEVGEPVMVTGAHLVSCISLDTSKVECSFSDGQVRDDFDISKIKIFDQSGNLISSNLISAKIVESVGVSKLEITVLSQTTIGSIGYESTTGSDDTTTQPGADQPVEEQTPTVEEPPTPASTIDCTVLPGAWVTVPGDPDYGTQDFCIMKYEAKDLAGTAASQAFGTPWAFINQTDAIAACSALGSGYQLLSNEEWMTITANAANIDSNWSGGSVGSGMIFIGHSDDNPISACEADPDDSKGYVEVDCVGKDANGDDDIAQRRTHSLSNGQVIWDLSGNLREWTSFSESVDKPSPMVTTYTEYTQPVTGSSSLPLNRLIPTQGVKSFWNDNWNSSQGIGMVRIGAAGTGGGLTRGGGFMGQNRNGIFRFRIDLPTDTASSTLGFRCTYSTP